MKVGLALSAGGARAVAHFGVLKILEEEGIRLHAITGSSMGAAIASLYALYPGTKELLQLAIRPLNDLPHDRIQKNIPDKFTLWNILNYLYGDVKIEDAALKLAIAAFDITRLRVKIFREGLIKMAVWAACAVPGVTPFARFDGGVYMDTALLCRAPVKEAFELGSEVVIESFVRIFPLDCPRNRPNLLVIPIDVPGVGWLDFTSWKTAFEAGLNSANQCRHDIKKIGTHPIFPMLPRK
jgi:NTE family protein